MSTECNVGAQGGRQVRMAVSESEFYQQQQTRIPRRDYGKSWKMYQVPSRGQEKRVKQNMLRNTRHKCEAEN